MEFIFAKAANVRGVLLFIVNKVHLFSFPDLFSFSFPKIAKTLTREVKGSIVLFVLHVPI